MVSDQVIQDHMLYDPWSTDLNEQLYTEYAPDVLTDYEATEADDDTAGYDDDAEQQADDDGGYAEAAPTREETSWTDQDWQGHLDHHWEENSWEEHEYAEIPTEADDLPATTELQWNTTGWSELEGYADGDAPTEEAPQAPFFE